MEGPEVSYIAYLNLAIAIIALVVTIYAILRMPFRRCGEPVIGDALVIIVYLLMVNTVWMAHHAPLLDAPSRAWHLFDTAVLLNIMFHAHHYSSRRHRRRPLP